MLQKLLDGFVEQAKWSGRLGSPLHQDILTGIVDGMKSGGVFGEFFTRFHGDNPMTVPLRFLATAHRMALQGGLPELAACYPTCGGVANAARAVEVLAASVTADGEGWLAAMPKAVQTNEVRRCCALLPGFLRIARRFGKPLRLLEAGCSAGLNLRWDHYGYRAGTSHYGDDASPVMFTDAFDGQCEPAPVTVASRCGCDLAPVALDEDGRMRLLSFVWADQVERFAQLDAAIEIARRVAAAVVEADAVEWVERELATRAAGVVTVVYHSVVSIYFPSEAKARFEALIREAGRRATEAAPLAWLSMEKGGGEAEVLLTMWPGGECVRIATTGFHGRDVRLL
ncbi:MAG: DUF2332 domain-containing protein [Acidobacteria bacterium]|nr:DUF2332 domain-containing protein [Acidobacteriota bacterium]